MEKSEMLKLEEKKEIKKSYNKILSRFLEKTEELCSMYFNKIHGLEEKIENEDLNGNGYSDQERYSYDFLSFYQTEGVQFLIENKRILIADEMGVGKTAQAIAGKIELENKLGRKVKTLVICPNRDVRNLWEERIKKYVKPERYAKINIENVDKYSEAKIQDSDFVVIDYHALSFSDEKQGNNGRKELKKKLMEAGFEYVILDEAHNAKNYLTSQRHKHVSDIANNATYLALLSGTPYPNSLRDTYSLIALLEPQRTNEKGKVIGYKDAKEVARVHAQTPSVIGAILRSRRLKRKLKDIKSMPPKKEEFYEVKIGKEQKDLYNSILDDETLEGMQKLQRLQKALLNPELIDPALKDIGKCKYESLDEIIERNVNNGEKTVIYSPNFKKGVLDVLMKRYARYGALEMHGGNRKEREKIRRKFQQNDKHKVIIVADVAGEGISLTAANNLVFLEEPYSPGERAQMIGRVWRPGQRKEVKIISLNVPGTIDDGIKEYLAKKNVALEYVNKGAKLTPEQKLILGSKDSIERWLALSITKNYLYTQEQIIFRLTGRMRGKDEKTVEKALKGAFGKQYVENYYKNWEESFSGNVANIYTKIIKGIEQKEKLEKKLDIASGAGMMSHALKETGIYNVDLNPHHFEFELSKKENHNIVGPMTKLRLDTESFDLALCSLALHLLPNTKEDPSRLKAIIEANRVLKKGGHYIIVLPGALVDEEGKLREGFKKTGFEVIPELTGHIRSVDKKIGAFAYVATLKKVGAPQPDVYYEDFKILTDSNEKAKVRHRRRRGKCDEFEFCDAEGNAIRSLEDSIYLYLNGGEK